MKMEIDKKESAAVIKLDGDLDFNSSIAFTEKINALIDDAPMRLVIDMSSVGHVDSMGLGSLTKLWKAADKSGCVMVLASVQKNVGKLLSLINLDNRIKIYDTAEAALKG